MLEDRKSLPLVLDSIDLSTRGKRGNDMSFGLTGSIERATWTLCTRFPEL